ADECRPWEAPDDVVGHLGQGGDLIRLIRLSAHKDSSRRRALLPAALTPCSRLLRGALLLRLGLRPGLRPPWRARAESPDAPPRFDRSWMSVTVIALSADFTMS